MTETLISLATAKLAKEKGVTWGFFRNKYTGAELAYSTCYNADGKIINPKGYRSNNPHFPCPTQSLLQKWLRDEHNWHIMVYPSDFINDPAKILYKYTIPNIDYHSELEFESYEEALEAGLQEALKGILVHSPKSDNW
jgi:hypothetical protein